MGDHDQNLPDQETFYISLPKKDIEVKISIEGDGSSSESSMKYTSFSPKGLTCPESESCREN